METPLSSTKREDASTSFRQVRCLRDRPNLKKMIPPHQGSLCRLDDDSGGIAMYAMEIVVQGQCYDLRYSASDFEFAQRLFAILDAENRGLVDIATVREFVILRCPVFGRRDEDLRRLQLRHRSATEGPASSATSQRSLSQLENNSSISSSPTFEEIWRSVAMCSRTAQEENSCRNDTASPDELRYCELGVEGWMVFCRFIALAQYLEAKRRFSARHLQQTMKQRNSPGGSELIMVDVPPAEPPLPLTPEQLTLCELRLKASLPAPELDLDHSMVAAHDGKRHRNSSVDDHGQVKINLFGGANLLPASVVATSHSNLEFALTYSQRRALGSSETDEIVVRRSMIDMKWLHETFHSHKVLGGTLCGRILPPFPSSGGGVFFPSTGGGVFSSVQFASEESLFKTTGGAITAATAGVNRLRDVAKSFFGAYLSSAASTAASVSDDSSTSSDTSQTRISKKKTPLKHYLPESYYNPHSPSGKARQLERYLNYLLEHPALSTSFPLNAILKSSQSGLEAAKQCLDECTRTAKRIKAQTPQLDDGKIAFSFWPTTAQTAVPTCPNFAWVRTAAQAALALRVHGILETTGMQSASARLQHAALPSFGKSGRVPSWEEEDSVHKPTIKCLNFQTETGLIAAERNNFECGVVNVPSELQSEDDLQGVDDYDLLPLPLPAPERRILSAGSDCHVNSPAMQEARFDYGNMSLQDTLRLREDEADSAFLGDISVDENIDKLREVIGSVDNTLSRCLASGGVIGKVQKERQLLHLDIVRGLDSWMGMRGKFVTQRSLLKGVAGIQQSREIFEEGDLGLVDDLSWQTALAHAAVSAAEDVRSSVRASRTAASAKAAADAAAFAAQSFCDTGSFSTIEDARAAQTRASIAQSHAIHAAVVDHEAKTAKRRATLALAHDVKCWNVHRKREMLRASIEYARSQHEATRRAVDAWSSLRDGFIGSTVIPSSHERRSLIPSPPMSSGLTQQAEEAITTIFESGDCTSTTKPTIVAVDHELFAPRSAKDTSMNPSKPSKIAADLGISLPFATASPITEEQEANRLCPKESNRSQSYAMDQLAENKSGSVEDLLSTSMQNIVDGLMSWGADFDADDDDYALPLGMAASIAFDESGIGDK